MNNSLITKIKKKKKKVRKEEPLGDQIKSIAFFAVSFSSQSNVSNENPFFLRGHVRTATAAAHRHLRHSYGPDPSE